MDQILQTVIDLINKNILLSAEERTAIISKLKEADKKITITEFKLDRTEKVKRTTAILLEETIEELEQKRKAVEEQNRELEIETSLERVRAVAMSMMKPDDMLEICKSISQQLTLLNVKEIRNVQTAIFYPAKGTYMNYEYYARHDKTFITETIYTNHEIAKAFADQMLKGQGEFYSTYINGAEVKDWITYQKTTNVFIDDYLNTAPSLNYYWHSLGSVALGISTYLPLKDEDKNLFNRFLKVFELSYKRYLDIERAEAQAREARIEASLEKVRSRSLAMQKSEELKEVIQVVYEQFVHLNILVEHAGFIMDYKERDDMHIWLADKHEVPSEIFISYFDSSHWNSFIEAKEKGLDFFANHLTFEEKNKFYKELFKLFPIADEAKEYYFNCAGLAISTVLLDNVGLYIENFSGIPYTNEENNTLMRFGKVFQQTYTRFLDLQKAEAQSRENQIQLALERVRARTMAMHQSTELADTSSVLFQQIKELGFETWSCGFCIWSKDDFSEVWMGADSGGLLPPMMIPYKKEPTHHEVYKASLRGDAVHEKIWEGEALKEHYAFLRTIPSVAKAIEVLENAGLSLPSKQCYYVGFFKQGYLLLITKEPNAEMYGLSKRFAGVFEQTYTRFLDLQKAEAQTKESQIQLALERVRARTMAMQKSDELTDVAAILFKQLNDLGIKTWTTGFNVWSDDNNFYTDYITNPQGGFMQPYIIDARVLPVSIKLSNAKNKGEEFFVNYQEGEELIKTYQQLSKFGETQFKGILESGFEFPSKQYEHFVFGAKASLMFITYEPVPEAHDIFKRFGKAFDQTYTRFLDLQKAEAQAREAQIELSLERVRAKTMAMHNSADVGETAAVMVDELKKLGIETIRCGIGIMHEPGDMEVWTIRSDENDKKDIIIGWLDMKMHSLLYNAFETWRNKNESYSYDLKDDDLISYYNAINNYPGYPIRYDINALPSLIHHNEFHFAEGTLFAFSLQQLTDEQRKIFKRFAGVFGQTYRRYLDLKNAEAQARQAKIEAAMEKVRSRTMAMQKPNELVEVAELLRTEMGMLGVEELETSSFYIHDEAAQKTECWYAIQQENKLVSDHMTIDLNDTDVGRQMLAFYHSNKKQTSIVMQGEPRKEWINYCAAHSKVLVGFYGDDIPDRTYHLYKFSNGYMGAASPSDISKESWDLLKRATSVFSLAYTRFSDLQKAEAQAREAQIETALERVRAIAMSMMKSDELMNVCEAVFKQLQLLDFTDVRAAQIYIRNDEKEKFLNYDYSESTGVDVVEVGYNSHPNTKRIFDVIKSAGDTLIDNVITKNELKAWKSYLYNTLKQPPEKNLDEATELHYYLYSIGTGAFGICTFKTISDGELQILKRLRNVFNLSYQRYNDMALAEAQAREAKIEAALERVRSRTLAMQKSEELAETSAVLFKQLIGLGIAPTRLYISILKDDAGNTEFWITDEDGSKVSMEYEDNLNNNPSFKKMFDGWKQQKKSLVIDMKGKELQQYFNHLSNINVPFKGGLAQKRRLQYIAFFSKGFIGMASPDEQPAETLQLLERFAYVFNLTFTRFNDLQLAEAHAVQAEEDLIKLQTEKRRAEDALIELRATQKQLVQSEKMASLGELTAGIAHEIQNPLNFVNNFSEVSKELIDEMKDALENGDKETADEIANDIIQNLEKINHHGKRADAIVKGMLQHSRSTTSQKEPTDINALTDEYIRLCYHGLRAKDNSFNASIKTDFDNTIEKINIIPQDIGRVLLNVLTNAFYAVNKKTKTAGNNYQPTVTVSTTCSPLHERGIGGEALITVSDNGNGIPQNIIDKIFQPFFTTKPTGQGTGLGLSLSYDIIKAHSGTITVESTESIGSVFVISLPLKA